MIWAVSLAVIGLLVSRRPGLLVALAIASFVLIPGVARNVLTPYLHPGAYLVWAGVAGLVLFRRSWLRDALSLSRGMLAAVGVFVAYALIDALNPGSHGLFSDAQSLTSFLLTPVIVAVVARKAVADRPRLARRLAGLFILLGIAEVVLAQRQNDSGEVLVWSDVYKSIWWWGQDDSIGRAIGTTGHGIQLSVFFAMTIALAPVIRSVLLRFAYVVACWAALPWTNGRLGMILAALTTAYLVLQSRRTPLRTVVFTVLAGAGIVISLESDAGQELLRKFNDDGGSNQKRIDALKWGYAHWKEFLFAGYPGNRDVRGGGLLQSTLENGFLMAGMAFGLVFAFMLFMLYVVQLSRVFMANREARMWAVAGAVGVGAFFGSSSFMADSLDGVTTWIILGVGLGLREKPKRRRSPATQPAGSDPAVSDRGEAGPFAKTQAASANASPKAAPQMFGGSPQHAGAGTVGTRS
ncbi:hypothetical protein [Arthrobacter sp. UM1]|uniref:hypothetical protein n=1 Tax=Arthrobacter sp. UM1 TaxID=2766776 RepID=UPI001CF61927|nr:hypothetical protein [Arthrobacter sp. UM1]MCB4207996.1 hypothetical protein [Arthrobacter sp. UM1]